MHLEILIEDSSGRCLLDHLLPKLIGPHGEPHTWRCHAYRGIGHLPRNLASTPDRAYRVLLNKLPSLLRGHMKTPGHDAVVVVVDTDRRDCAAFLAELREVARACEAFDKTMFRFAIEEVEAWYFGDRAALIEAYPKARTRVLDRYVQDSVCGTWEVLADAIYPGGSKAIQKAGSPLPGQLKHDWANRVGPLLDPDRNQSPSFARLRDGLRRLTRSHQEAASPS